MCVRGVSARGETTEDGSDGGGRSGIKTRKQKPHAEISRTNPN